MLLSGLSFYWKVMFAKLTAHLNLAWAANPELRSEPCKRALPCAACWCLPAVPPELTPALPLQTVAATYPPLPCCPVPGWTLCAPASCSSCCRPAHEHPSAFDAACLPQLLSSTLPGAWMLLHICCPTWTRPCLRCCQAPDLRPTGGSRTCGRPAPGWGHTSLHCKSATLAPHRPP